MAFAAIYFGVFILGLLLGSYLNSWMWRVHEGKWMFGGRSVCVHCGVPLFWYDNIPLVSYALLRGKCRACKGAIPGQYFVVELVTGVALALLVWFHANSIETSYWPFLRDCFFVTILIITFFYDAKYSIILSSTTWAGALIGLYINIFKLGASPLSLMYGMLLGGGFFLAQYLLSHGKWVGGGDVRLGVMMGAWLGFSSTLVALMSSYFLGALCVVPLLIANKKKMESEIPFGTFLSIGTIIALFWGSTLVHWYLKIVGW